MLRRLDIENFTVFRTASLRFKQLNIIHGENGTGKTHLLKLAYVLQHAMACRPATAADDKPTKSVLQRSIAEELVEVFCPDRLGRLTTRTRGQSKTLVSARFIKKPQRTTFSFRTGSKAEVGIDEPPTRWLEKPPVYLPTREVLSIYPGFVSLYETHALEFDRTWRDLCLLLGAPVARGVKEKRVRDLLEPIEEVMGGRIDLDKAGRFYLVDERGRIEMHLVAEGMRKLAMLARLVATGSLVDKGCLLWDEPEANLNPRLIKRVARVLLALAGQGVQVFLATHSLFLMREIHVLHATMPSPVELRYFGLHLNDGEVVVRQGATIEETGDIAALDEELMQTERFLDVETGVAVARQPAGAEE